MTPASRAGRFRRLDSRQRGKGGETNRPTNKHLDSLGIFLMITGAVIAMGVSSVRGLSTELVVILILLALAFVAGGLALRRYNRPKDDI